MPYYTSSYTFVTRGTQRTFHHLWHLNGQIYECCACGSACCMSQAYNKHWRQQQCQSSVLSAARLRQMDIISTAGVEYFLLCNEAVGGDTQQFLLDAGINAVPAFLRFMFHGARRLDVKVAFYVRLDVERGRVEDLICQSSELAVRHHFDIGESIDVLFAMLLEKIIAYANLATLLAPDATNARRADGLEHFQIKRLRINVKRSNDAKLSLPLQYRLKRAVGGTEVTDARSSPTKQMHVETASAAYRRHLRNDNARLPSGVNLFCFRTCPNSKELYTVPYHLEDASDFLNTPSFVVVDSVEGEFQRLVEVTNLRRFLREDAVGRILDCNRCKAKFMQRTHMALHKMLQCGRDFEILKMSSDYIEMYENCLSMKCADYDWPLYAIMR